MVALAVVLVGSGLVVVALEVVASELAVVVLVAAMGVAAARRFHRTSKRRWLVSSRLLRQPTALAHRPSSAQTTQPEP